MEGVPSGLDSFSKDYFKSKFVVYDMNHNSLVGGKEIFIIFREKPDRLFVAWVYRTSEGAYDLRSFWQNQNFDKEAMEAIRKAFNISQVPAL